MKKALILSLGLAVVFGLTGCTKENKLTETLDSVVETVEKPVMILGEGLQDAAEAVTDVAGDAVDAVGDAAENVADKVGDLAEDAKKVVEDTAENIVGGGDTAEKAEELLEEAAK